MGEHTLAVHWRDFYHTHSVRPHSVEVGTELTAWVPAVLYDAADAVGILHVEVFQIMTTTSRGIRIYRRRDIARLKIWG